MYRIIVARQVRATFEGLSQGDPLALTTKLAPSFDYRFIGDHALGGRRTTIGEMDQWLTRVFRLFPGIRFRLRDMTVKGMPWKTVVMTRLDVEAKGYHNEMFQRIELRWGKIVDVVTLEDNQRLQAHLDILSDNGCDEAVAPPIDSPLPVE